MGIRERARQNEKEKKHAIMRDRFATSHAECRGWPQAGKVTARQEPATLRSRATVEDGRPTGILKAIASAKLRYGSSVIR